MNSLRIFNRLTLILLLTVSLLCFVVFKLWQDLQMGQHPTESASTTQSTQPASRKGLYQQGLISFTPPPVNVFNEILERPLFTNGRLPPDQPLQTANDQPKVQLRLRLEGVATVGDKRIALVRDLSNNELLRLQQGMQHQGWKVNEVKPESTEFKRGNETTELLFDIEHKAKLQIPPVRLPRSKGKGVRKRPTR